MFIYFGHWKSTSSTPEIGFLLPHLVPGDQAQNRRFGKKNL